VGCKSEKFDKRLWHKRLRRIEQQKLNSTNDMNYLSMPIIREVSNPWCMVKDGKHIYCTIEGLRKEINIYIAELINSFDPNEYFKGGKPISVHGLIEYYKIDKFEKLYNITNNQKEKFIRHFFKKYTRK
jgi:hypothetical protein